MAITIGGHQGAALIIVNRVADAISISPAEEWGAGEGTFAGCGFCGSIGPRFDR